MNIEQENLSWPKARPPKNVQEQEEILKNITMEDREKICQALHLRVVLLLASEGIKIESSIHRVKTEKRIEEKRIRKGKDDPINDIWGIRVVTEEPDRERISRIIQSAFPLTPEVLPDGKKSDRDYRDPEVRNEHRENSNPHMSKHYRARHKNFVVWRKDQEVYDIGEVQIMTKDELRIYNETRPYYPNGHSQTS